MKKLYLDIEETIQGEFTPKNLNLLLIFQVNCPGCFLYALPLFNQLYQQFSKQLGFIGIATAFEDFDLNTEENAKLLVHKGEIVGETKKAFLQQGTKKLPYKLHFPIAMDATMAPSQKQKLIDTICAMSPYYEKLKEQELNILKNRVGDYIEQQEKIAMTFTANQFKGTPTIALFNNKNELLDSWFGHQPINIITKSIESYSK